MASEFIPHKARIIIRTYRTIAKAVSLQENECVRACALLRACVFQSVYTANIWITRSLPPGDVFF